ncbi:MAG: hypothetical protein AMS17_14735 [Spirochaetes bacterium DG_61]|jgi:chemotaxis protein CheD|nr:MAG: hypothetical protein AMS17_14735 [Spirochaetes bacterium DG_61]
MSEQTVLVKMAEMDIVENNGRGAIKLKTTLGSCVGIILSDKMKGIHGLAHIMLPERTGRDSVVGKYADTAIPLLLDKMEKRGSKRSQISAYVVGGACMFEPYKDSGIATIGEKNVEVSKKMLKSLNIPIVFEETGGIKGRTIIFDIDSCTINVRALEKITLPGVKN